MYNILVVDDHPMILHGIKALLFNNLTFQITHEAANGEAAWKTLETFSNDIHIVVTDIAMPVMDGLTLAKRIKQTFPYIKVLVLTMDANATLVGELLEIEAEGCLLKDTGRREFTEALTFLVNDRTYYTPSVIANYMQQRRKLDKTQGQLNAFSPRESEVLKLILNEKSSDEIAAELFISRRTVDVHRQHILEKSGCKTIVGLIKFGYECGIIG